MIVGSKMTLLRTLCIAGSILSLSVASAWAEDIEAGKARYAENCSNCHGPAGRGMASYPKISGRDVAYLVDRLETYRAGTKVGPNSGLMIAMATDLTDEEISNLAAYLNAVE